MREQRITIEIGFEGELTAEADGFTGDLCIKDLEKMLADLALQAESTVRKTPDRDAHVRVSSTVELNSVEVTQLT